MTSKWAVLNMMPLKKISQKMVRELYPRTPQLIFTLLKGQDTLHKVIAGQSDGIHVTRFGIFDLLHGRCDRIFPHQWVDGTDGANPVDRRPSVIFVVQQHLASSSPHGVSTQKRGFQAVYIALGLVSQKLGTNTTKLDSQVQRSETYTLTGRLRLC